MHSLFWLLPLALGLSIAGLVYQWLGALHDRKRLMRRGSLVDVENGRRMYLSQMGAGGPTVIFESGIAATSQNWAGLQKSVSSFARTVTYDRAGLGWSSPSASDRTPSNIVRELHTLLQQAAVPPPYLLVGHSFGALVVRRFAAEHPGDVAGVVLVDAMRPEEWPPISEAQRKTLEHGMRLARIAMPLAHLGVARLLITSMFGSSSRVVQTIRRAARADGQLIVERVTGEVGKMPREVWPVVAAHWSSPRFYHGLAAHLRAIPATVREMQAADPIEGIPVLVLVAGNAEPLSPDALRRIAPRARQVIAEKSEHWIHLDEPHLVLKAIRGMIEQIRAAAPPSVPQSAPQPAASQAAEAISYRIAATHRAPS
jgi:pimeloyl-ACP methyl ester carboxylesterase